MRGLFMIAALLAMSSCASLSPEELAQLESRTYSASKERVFRATVAVLKGYAMGVQDADLDQGVVISNIGGNTMGMVGNTVGYQIRVTIMPAGPSMVRVRPAWQMNVSSDHLHPLLMDVPPDHKPSLYEDFFAALDARLSAHPTQ